MMNKIFKENTDNGFIQFFRYGMVGVGATLLDFTALFVLTEFLGVYYLASAAIAYLAGFIANYLLCVHWVFAGRCGNKADEIWKISLVGAVGLALTALLIWIFTEYLGFYYLFSKLAAIVIVFFWNFFARRHVVFKPPTCRIPGI